MIFYWFLHVKTDILSVIYILLGLCWIIYLIFYLRKEKRMLNQKLERDHLIEYYEQLKYNFQTFRVKITMLTVMLASEIMMPLFILLVDLAFNLDSTERHNPTSHHVNFFIEYFKFSAIFLYTSNFFFVIFLIILVTAYLTLRYNHQPTKPMFKKYITLFLLQSIIIFILANPYTFTIATIVACSIFFGYLTIFIFKRKLLIAVLESKILLECDAKFKEVYQKQVYMFRYLSKFIIFSIIVTGLVGIFQLLTFVLAEIYFYYPSLILCHKCISSINFNYTRNIVEIDQRYISVIMADIALLAGMLPLLAYTIRYIIYCIHNKYFKKHQYRFNHSILKQPLLRN